MIKLHVFDIDGTVLNSMPMWDRIASEYLEELGIEAPPDLAEIIDPMPIPDVYRYLAEKFSVPGGVDAVADGFYRLISYEYAHNVRPFPDAMAELEELRSKGERMVAFSNTLHAILDAAISKGNISSFFEEVYCVEDVGFRKDTPESFIKLAEMTGVDPSDILVHDDSDFALAAARKAGCQVKAYYRYR